MSDSLVSIGFLIFGLLLLGCRSPRHNSPTAQKWNLGLGILFCAFSLITFIFKNDIELYQAKRQEAAQAQLAIARVEKIGGIIKNLKERTHTTFNLTYISLQVEGNFAENNELVRRVFSEFEQSHPEVEVIGAPIPSETYQSHGYLNGIYIYHRPKPNLQPKAENDGQ